MRRTRLLAAASLLLWGLPALASAELAGPAASAVADWVAKGSYRGCYELRACLWDASHPIDVRYSPTGGHAVVLVPWSAPDGAAGTSVGIFREDNDGWSFVGSSEDLARGSLWKVYFVGNEATFITCTAIVADPETCRGRAVGTVDLGR